MPDSHKPIDEVRDGRHLMDHPPVMYRREACAGMFVEPSLDRMRENAASWLRAVEAYGRAKFIAEVGPVVRAALNAEQRTGEEGV